MTLPRIKCGEESEPQSLSGKSEATEAKLRILIVDDNIDAAQMLGMFLKTSGHQVLLEHSSRRALERAGPSVTGAA